jgi:hypothetical protein
MNYGLKIVWEEVIAAYFKSLTNYTHIGTGEDQEKYQDSSCPTRDWNLGPPEYKLESTCAAKPSLNIYDVSLLTEINRSASF